MSGMSDITWTNVTVKLAALIPWDGNPKTSTGKNAAQLTNSFDELGQFQTIAIGPDGEVYDGHQRLSALKAKHGGAYTVDARQSSRPLTDQERRKIAIYSRQIGAWDWGALSSWDAGELMEWGFDEDLLKDWGQDYSNLAEMLSAKDEPPAQGDAEPQTNRAEELRELWGVESGQLWQLGEHRLICGDAKDTGIVCDFAVFDPPWNWPLREQSQMLDWVSYKNCCVMGLSECFGLSERDDYISFLIWDQLTGVNISNVSKYLSHRSLVMMMWFGDQERFYKLDALKILHENGLAESYVADIPQYIPIVRKYGTGKEVGHPDVKPLPLCDFLITLYSRKSDVVGDPFAGSGSFLISAHKLGRKYYGSEIDPTACSVILERFYEFTKIKPILISNQWC